MGMMAGNEEERSRLVAEICELSARAIACSNLHHPRTNKSPFIDWYLVLRIDENADICSIRRQYHKLALQLHPDKNKHSKAETAFKLVSEAFYRLSNAARRTAFDSERETIFCTKCNTDPPTHTNTRTQKLHQETSRNSRIQRRMKELQVHLRNEATIIEKCLIRSAREPTNANRTRAETPIFNPSDYQYKGYPHHRTINCRNLEDLSSGFKIGNRGMQKTANYESPIFEYRSRRSPFMASRYTRTRE